MAGEKLSQNPGEKQEFLQNQERVRALGIKIEEIYNRFRNARSEQLVEQAQVLQQDIDEARTAADELSSIPEAQADVQSYTADLDKLSDRLRAAGAEMALAKQAKDAPAVDEVDYSVTEEEIPDYENLAEYQQGITADIIEPTLANEVLYGRTPEQARNDIKADIDHLTEEIQRMQSVYHDSGLRDMQQRYLTEAQRELQDMLRKQQMVEVWIGERGNELPQSVAQQAAGGEIDDLNPDRTAEEDAAAARTIDWAEAKYLYDQMPEKTRATALRGVYLKERAELMAKGMGEAQADAMIMQDRGLSADEIKEIMAGVTADNANEMIAAGEEALAVSRKAAEEARKFATEEEGVGKKRELRRERADKLESLNRELQAAYDQRKTMNTFDEGFAELDEKIDQLEARIAEEKQRYDLDLQLAGVQSGMNEASEAEQQNVYDQKAYFEDVDKSYAETVDRLNESLSAAIAKRNKVLEEMSDFEDNGDDELNLLKNQNEQMELALKRADEELKILNETEQLYASWYEGATDAEQKAGFLENLNDVRAKIADLTQRREQAEAQLKENTEKYNKLHDEKMKGYDDELSEVALEINNLAAKLKEEQDRHEGKLAPEKAENLKQSLWEKLKSRKGFKKVFRKVAQRAAMLVLATVLSASLFTGIKANAETVDDTDNSPRIESTESSTSASGRNLPGGGETQRKATPAEAQPGAVQEELQDVAARTIEDLGAPEKLPGYSVQANGTFMNYDEYNGFGNIRNKATAWSFAMSKEDVWERSDETEAANTIYKLAHEQPEALASYLTSFPAALERAGLPRNITETELDDLISNGENGGEVQRKALEAFKWLLESDSTSVEFGLATGNFENHYINKTTGAGDTAVEHRLGSTVTDRTNAKAFFVTNKEVSQDGVEQTFSAVILAKCMNLVIYKESPAPTPSGTPTNVVVRNVTPEPEPETPPAPETPETAPDEESTPLLVVDLETPQETPEVEESTPTPTPDPEPEPDPTPIPPRPNPNPEPDPVPPEPTPTPDPTPIPPRPPEPEPEPDPEPEPVPIPPRPPEPEPEPEPTPDPVKPAPKDPENLEHEADRSTEENGGILTDTPNLDEMDDTTKEETGRQETEREEIGENNREEVDNDATIEDPNLTPEEQDQIKQDVEDAENKADEIINSGPVTDEEYEDYIESILNGGGDGGAAAGENNG